MRLPAALSLAVASALLVLGCGSSSMTPPSSVGQQLDAALPSSITDAVLVSSTGRRFTLASLGKIVVLSDVMTLCQESCPLDTADVVAAARAVERKGLGSKIQFVSLTIDPARDTVPRLAAYRRQFGGGPTDWTVATGATDLLRAFWKQLGVYIHRTPSKPPAPPDWLTGEALTYDLTHSDVLLFIDRRGHERFLLEGTAHVAAGTSLPPRIAAFMDAGGRRNLTHPRPLAWTVADELHVLAWLTAGE